MKPHRIDRQFDKASAHSGCTSRPSGTRSSPMIRDREFRQLVAQAQKRLRETVYDAEALFVDLANIHRMLSASAALDRPIATTPTPAPSNRIAIVNGRRLTDNELQNLREDNYDVILDLTPGTLHYREDPEGHSPLRLSDLRGIGPYRIKILTFMIERLGTPLCADSADDLLGETERIANPESFTKSISILRQALGGAGRRNPYIISIAAWESSRRRRACAYLLNPQWQYLLITHGKSQKSRIRP